MSEPLSRLYRQALKQEPVEGLAAAQLIALTEGRLQGDERDAVLERLAADPAAPALLAFVREADHEARILALELRRADAVARSWARPRRRRLAWAAAAALAVIVLAVPLSLKDQQSGGDQFAADAAALAVDREVILAASFEGGRGSESGSDSHSNDNGNGNGSIFHSRFDG